MKNVFYVFYATVKALFVRKLFKFLYWLFGHIIDKQLDKKAKPNYKIYDINWETNNYNAHIVQYLKK